MRDDAKDYLNEDKIRSLIERDAEYGASPIYLWSSTPTDADGDETADAEAEEDTAIANHDKQTWVLVNDRAPLWMRDPKDVSDEEYEVS